MQKQKNLKIFEKKDERGGRTSSFFNKFNKVNLVNMPVSGIYNLVNDSSKNNLQYYEPLGLLYLASALRKAGYGVDLVDLNIERENHNLESIAKRCTEDSKIVGISTYTMLHDDVISLSNAIKNNDKSIIVIVGGHHATYADEELLKSGGIDYVVRGEGENTLIELVERIKSNENPSLTLGISYKQDGKIIRTPNRPFIEDLNTISFPARDLVSNVYYTMGKELTITTSRGCAGRCIFCTSPNFWNRKVRFRSPNNVGEELLGFFSEHKDIPSDLKINFVDDNLTLGGSARFAAILNYLKKIGNRFELYSRIDSISEKMLCELLDTNVSRIRFGIESGSERMLKMLRKGQTLEKIRRTLDMAKNYGIELHGTFMIGFPTEHENEVKQTISFACSLPLDYAFFFSCTPYPGTEMWNRYASDSVKYSHCDNMNCKENRFGTFEIIPPERKIELLAEAYESFYFGKKGFAKPSGYDNITDPLKKAASVTDLIFSKYFT